MSPSLANSPVHAPHITAQAKWPGVEFRVSRENIAAPTIWTLDEKCHTAIIHLSGKIHRLETELDGRSEAFSSPLAGEFWLIPAGTRYASYARGETVSYAEVCIDVTDWEEIRSWPALAPRLGHYDEFLYQTTRQLTDLARHNDDL